MAELHETFINCPKCGSEIKHLGYGGIKFESCPNCHGIFLDHDEVGHENLDDVVGGMAKPEAEAKHLDTLEIRCPKCDQTMEKHFNRYKKGLLLDVCPSCKGIWFDQGEFERSRGKLGRFLTKQGPVMVWFECKPCKIKKKHEDIRSQTSQGAQCPRCGNAMHLQGVAPSIIPDLKNDLVAVLVWVIPITALFFICRAALGSWMNAAILTGIVGILSLLVIGLIVRMKL